MSNGFPITQLSFYKLQFESIKSKLLHTKLPLKNMLNKNNVPIKQEEIGNGGKNNHSYISSNKFHDHAINLLNSISYLYTTLF